MVRKDVQIPIQRKSKWEESERKTDEGHSIAHVSSSTAREARRAVFSPDAHISVDICAHFRVTTIKEKKITRKMHTFNDDRILPDDNVARDARRD